MDTHFQRIERLPPYVFNIIGELKQAARARGEDIIDFGMGNLTSLHRLTSSRSCGNGWARRYASLLPVQGYTQTP